jgi:Domain of unknown function (DUF4192)
VTLGPAALVRSLPAALGHTPTDALVIVGVSTAHPDAATVATVDLSGIDSEEEAEDAAENVPTALTSAVRDGATSVAVLAYADDADQPLSVSSRMAETAAVYAELVGLGVLDTIAVFRGRWRSYLCTDTSCCPPEGTPIITEPTP